MTISASMVLVLFISARHLSAETFEVASLKASKSDARGGAIGGGPGSADPFRFSATNASLQGLVMFAYGVRMYQISGPAWMGSTRFDIQAVVPQGATKASLRVMVQNLLSERLNLQVHHESRALARYILTLKAPGKLKAAAAGARGSPDEAGKFSVDKDGIPVLPPGIPQIVSGVVNKQLMFVARSTGMTALAETLGNQLRQPVVDMTGLDGVYDFTLTFRMGDPQGDLRAGNGLIDEPAGPTLFEAVQDQLGLRLEQSKAPTDVIVVDHADKMPAAN